MILETIAEATRKRVAAEKEKCSLAEMKTNGDEPGHRIPV